MWAVVGYASAAGLHWLDERTIGRPVRLLIGDTRVGFAKDRVSVEDRIGAMRFINRPDVRITNWYRRKGGYRTVHAKAWAVMPDGARGNAAGVVVGSANLTKQGLHHNTELVALVVGDEARRIVREMETAFDESWDAKANLLRRLGDGVQTNSQSTPRTWRPAGFGKPSTSSRKPRHPPMPSMAPRSTKGEINRAARAALLLGIAAFFSSGVTAPLGIVMGHMGRHRAKKLVGNGRRLAMAGLICSYAWLPAFASLWLTR